MTFHLSKRIALLLAVVSLLPCSRSHAVDVVFTRVAAPFLGVRGGAMAWGDYDNDGYLDVIILGDAPGSNGVTALYHNNGDGTFTRMPFNFVGYRSGSVAWGDFDNDGYLDVLICGLGNDSATRVYRNLGGTNFVEFQRFGLQYDGKVSWGDFNNDGKLDFAVCGAGAYNQVYQNLGGTNFALLNTGMPQVYYGSVGWADYDCDGKLDLLVTGMNNSGGSGSYVYRNLGGGQFNLAWSAGPWEPGQWLDIDNDGWPDLAVGYWPYQATYIYQNNRLGGFKQVAALPIGPLAVGDFDNDGWTDLLINNKLLRNYGTAAWTSSSTSLPDLGTSTLVNNAFPGDFDNDGRLDLILSDSSYTTYLYRNVTDATNLPPAAPTGLGVAATRTQVQLNWNAAVDDHQASGLTYNLRVGTRPGAGDIISPMSAPNGFRRVVRGGNAGTLTHYTLLGLKAGTTYYWSVQAVDNAFAGSAFAPEQSFVATVLPTISTLSNQTVFQDSAPLELPFTVGDLETPAHDLAVSATSSNPQLVAPGDLVLSGTESNRTLVVTLEPHQVGTTTITVTVIDGDGGQASQQFQLVVLKVNHPPVAEITVSPLLQLPGLNHLTALASLTGDATLVLDGSHSSDVDGDALQFAWTAGTNLTPFANGMVTTNTFAPGAWSITLWVSDGTNTSTATVEVDVLTPAQAVGTLAASLRAAELAPGPKQALLASLDAAAASFSRGQLAPGVNQLQAFQSKIPVLLAPRDPVLGGVLARGADEIIKALTD